MEIVIDIPQNVFLAFKMARKQDFHCCYYDVNSVIGNAIKNGVPLPEFHGDLVDNDNLFANKKGV